MLAFNYKKFMHEVMAISFEYQYFRKLKKVWVFLVKFGKFDSMSFLFNLLRLCCSNKDVRTFNCNHKTSEGFIFLSILFQFNAINNI